MNRRTFFTRAAQTAAVAMVAPAIVAEAVKPDPMQEAIDFFSKVHCSEHSQQWQSLGSSYFGTYPGASYIPNHVTQYFPATQNNE